jgi:NAD(P)-dependent dehydrogenase (short-subunit alcohol dehydrogenase family)
MMSGTNPTNSVFAETLGQARPNQRLRDRKILVVGGGQRNVVDEQPPIGNGRAISVLCAREGAHVVVLDVNREAAEATVTQIREEVPSARAEAYQLDVRNTSEIVKAVDGASKTLGGLDGVVLVVGISKGLPLARMTTEAWDDDFAVNVRSHMLFAKRALETMEPGGAVVVLSSLASITAGSGNPAYETSKAAQLGLVRAIAKAGEAKGMRCNGIAPVRSPVQVHARL